MRIWKEKINGKVYWFADFTKNGTRYRLKEETRDVLDEDIEGILDRARREKYGLYVEEEIISLGELVKAYVKDLNVKSRPARQKKYTLEKFEKHLGSSFPLQKLSTADVKSFARELGRQSPDLLSTSLNRYLNDVNAMLHKAEEYFSALEHWKPPRMPFEPEPEQGRERVITEEEQARLFFHLRATRGKIENPDTAAARDRRDGLSTPHGCGPHRMCSPDRHAP